MLTETETKYVPIEDMEVISAVIEEFVDHFHHGKEETAYFPETKENIEFSEDMRNFLIEHEFGRRVAIMLRKAVNNWKSEIKRGRSGRAAEETSCRTYCKIFESICHFY